MFRVKAASDIIANIACIRVLATIYHTVTVIPLASCSLCQHQIQFQLIEYYFHCATRWREWEKMRFEKRK